MVPRTPKTWSLAAGGFAFLCSTFLLGVIRPVSDVLARLLNMPDAVSPVLLAAPVAVIGTPVWWALIEREGAVTYLRGATAGFVTAVATVAFWLVVFAIIWDPALVLAGSILVAFVTGLVVPAGLAVGMAMTYLRRNFGDGPRDGWQSVLDDGL